MLIGYTAIATSLFCGGILVKNIINGKNNTIIGLVLLIIFFLVPGIKLLRDYYSYRLILTDDSLIQKQSKNKTRIIKYTDIKTITIDNNYLLVCIETQQGEKIILNKTLKNIKEIIELLKIHLPSESIKII